MGGPTKDSAYIDDVSSLATGYTEDENIHTLIKSHANKRRWANTHRGLFSLDKYQFIHFPPPLPA
jgi:hypothetical protein